MRNTEEQVAKQAAEIRKEVESLTQEQHDDIMSFCLSPKAGVTIEFIMAYGLFFAFRNFLINRRAEQ